jgi:hypothetical protein
MELLLAGKITREQSDRAHAATGPLDEAGRPSHWPPRGPDHAASVAAGAAVAALDPETGRAAQDAPCRVLPLRRRRAAEAPPGTPGGAVDGGGATNDPPYFLRDPRPDSGRSTASRASRRTASTRARSSWSPGVGAPTTPAPTAAASAAAAPARCPCGTSTSP